MSASHVSHENIRYYCSEHLYIYTLKLGVSFDLKPTVA